MVLIPGMALGDGAGGGGSDEVSCGGLCGIVLSFDLYNTLSTGIYTESYEKINYYLKSDLGKLHAGLQHKKRSVIKGNHVAAYFLHCVWVELFCFPLRQLSISNVRLCWECL